MDGVHDPFCDSIIMYVMIAIPIIVKIAGTICAQIWRAGSFHAKSRNISESAMIPTTVAIRQITIFLIFLEFAISFSVLTSFAFKFD